MSDSTAHDASDAHSEAERAALDAAAFIEAHLDEEIPLELLAREVGLSASHLQRTFTRLFGHSPKQHQTGLRVETLKRRLREGEGVSEAAYASGFGSSRGAYEAAAPRLGMRPTAYRSGGEGLTIRYAVAASAIGLVLVGRTDIGVCAVMLGDDRVSLVEALASEFSRAGLVGDDVTAAGDATAVAAYVSGGSDAPTVALDLHGTEFQRAVWTALTRIPSGTTATYADIARGIGAPSAYRAVANACGDNHVAVLVPCHRVVRTGGGLGGYKWGIERKRLLLAREGADIAVE